MDRAPARIVLAEDDAPFRQLVATVLRGSGHEVIELLDGAQLLEYVANRLTSDGSVRDVDLIITDLRMPHFTGLDVLAALRRVLVDTPVIVITAFGDPETHAHARALDAVAVLDKPFDVDELAAAVSSSLVASPRA
jgi:CheY-like chemotaxis protein